MIESFGILERLGNALPFDELPNLAADGREHLQEVVVGGAHFPTEELDDSDDFRTVIDGKGEGAVHAFFDGRGRAREVIIAGRVHDPCRLAAGPNATRQSLVRGKRHLPSLFFELRRFDTWIMPKRDAAHQVDPCIHLPDRSDLPSHAHPDGLKNLWRCIFEGWGLGQDMSHGIIGGPAAFHDFSGPDVSDHRQNCRLAIDFNRGRIDVHGDNSPVFGPMSALAREPTQG